MSHFDRAKLPMIPGIRRDMKGRESNGKPFYRGHTLGVVNQPPKVALSSLSPVSTTRNHIRRASPLGIEEPPEDVDERRDWLLCQLEQLDTQGIESKTKLKPIRPSPGNLPDVISPKSTQRKKNQYELSNPPSWLEHDRNVLRFYSYFKEPVHESPIENYRVRKCIIFYYLEDGSFQINEPKQDNSGAPQGIFLRRGQWRKENGDEFTLKDFLVGMNVTVSSRTFFVVDADSHTRTFLLENEGIDLLSAQGYPDDPHTLHRERVSSALDPLSGGKNDSIAYRRRPDTLRQFLQNDRKVLRFFCSWDDKSLYGEVIDYVLHFFLSDNTIEVLEVAKRNSGRDPFPLLLRRQKLPRDLSVPSGHETARGTERPAVDFVTLDDLICGHTLVVYGRELMLHDCDDFTKKFFKEELGLAQAVHPRMSATPTRKKEEVKPAIPPYNGFGGEEDSLRNCLSLVPKTTLDRVMDDTEPNQALRFDAKFLEPKTIQDASRRFIISYFISDKMVSIFEPPQRNSGILGGKFLEKGKYKNGDDPQQRFLDISNFYAGSVLKFICPPFNTTLSPFVLTGCDEFSEKYLKQEKEKAKEKALLKNHRQSSRKTLPSLKLPKLPSLEQDKRDVVDAKSVVSSLSYETVDHFASSFFHRKRVLMKHFLSFDVDRTGYIVQEDFVTSLQRSNEDYPSKELEIIENGLFPQDISYCKYDDFLAAIFGRKLKMKIRRT